MHTTEAVIFAIVAQVINLLSSVSLPLCLLNWFSFLLFFIIPLLISEI